MLAYSIPLVASFFEATDRAAVLLKHRPEIRTGRLFVRRHRSTDWFLRHAPLPLGFAVVKLPDFNCGQNLYCDAIPVFGSAARSTTTRE
jgi:hypothetical protein